MHKNHIVVANVSEEEFRLSVTNLAYLYEENPSSQGIQLYQKKADSRSFLVLFENPPEFESFTYFVNYLRYPEGLDHYGPLVRGYFQTKDIPEKNKFAVGEWIMLYVSKKDKAFDNVNIVNENNETYLNDFGGFIKKLDTTEEPFQVAPLNLTDYTFLVAVSPLTTKADKTITVESKPWWKFW